MNLSVWLWESLRELLARPPATPTIPVPIIDEDGLVGYAEIPLGRPLPDTYNLPGPLPEKVEDAKDLSTRRYCLRSYWHNGETMAAYVRESADPEKLRRVVQRHNEAREKLEMKTP